MRQYEDSVSSATTGLPVYEAEISVLTQPGGTPAQLYSDNGVTPLAQPVLTDGLGFYRFFIADGVYTLVIAGPGGVSPRTVPNVEIYEDARNVSVPVGEPGVEIPSVGARMGKLLGFDGAGTPIGVAASAEDLAAIAAIAPDIELVADNIDEILAAPDYAAAAAASAADAQESAENAALYDPTSYTYSAVTWPERLVTTYPKVYVDAVAGNDATTTATYTLPAKTPLRILALFPENATTPMMMLMAGQAHVSRDPTYNTGLQFGNTGLSSFPRNVFNYGSHPLAPLLDARQDLSGKTFTLISGSSVTWETTATLLSQPVLNAGAGINDAASSNFTLTLDDVAGDNDPPAPLSWVTNHTNVAGNDALIEATPGSWGINVVGNTAADIRVSGITGPSGKNVRIVVHLPDGSNPNGKPLKLHDAQGIAIFNGGEYGHLRLIGGAQKDNVTFTALNGVFPTFQSLEVILPGCHGGVGGRNVIGKYTAIGQPISGVPIAASQGRTLGGMLHIFNPYDFRSTSLYFGEFEVANGTTGFYGHGSGAGPFGYKSVIVARRSKATNCSTAVHFDGGYQARTGFLTEGLFLNGGIDIVDCENALGMTDEPIWHVNGGSFTPKAGQVTLAPLSGSNNTLYLKDFTINAKNVSSASPFFYKATLANWQPYYGYSGSTPPTIVFDNVQDVTPISSNVHKFSFYAAASTYPNASRTKLRLINGTKLGDQWAFPSWDTYPDELYCDDSGIWVGFGGKTRQQVRDAMAALGLPCTIPNSVTMVNYAGAVVDAGI